MGLRIAEVAALLAVGAFLVWATRGFTFLQDEWDFIQYRGGAWNPKTFLTPHNQHLVATDILVYKLLFATVGIGDFLAYRLAGVAIHLVCVALLFEVVRRRVGTMLAAAASLPVALLGTGWYVVLNPFNMQWSLSLASLLAILLLLDHPGRRYDPLISLLVLLALASSSFGVPVVIGLTAYFLVQRGARGRLWVVLLPFAIYGAWYLSYGVDAGHAPGYEVTLSPVYLCHLVAGALGGLLGVPLAAAEVPARDLVVAGIHLVALLLVVLVALVVKRRGLSPRLGLVMATAVAFWLLLTLSRGYLNSPYATHYAFVGVVLLLLMAVELISGFELSAGVRTAAVGFFAVSALLNAIVLVHYANVRRADSEVVMAQIGALQLARENVAPTFKPNSDPEQAPSVVAGPLLASVDRLGSSPGFDATEITAASEGARAAADRVLVEAGQSEVGGVAGWAQRGAACQALGPGRELALPDERLVFRPQDGRRVRVDLRSFATSFSGAGTTVLTHPQPIEPPAGGGPTGWRARVASSGSVEVCKRRR